MVTDFKKIAPEGFFL